MGVTQAHVDAVVSQSMYEPFDSGQTTFGFFLDKQYDNSTRRYTSASRSGFVGIDWDAAESMYKRLKEHLDQEETFFRPPFMDASTGGWLDLPGSDLQVKIFDWGVKVPTLLCVRVRACTSAHGCKC